MTKKVWIGLLIALVVVALVVGAVAVMFGGEAVGVSPSVQKTSLWKECFESETGREVCISVWSGNEIDGRIVYDSNNADAYNRQVFTIDSGLTRKLISTATYVAVDNWLERPLFKGYIEGQVGRETMRISHYGDFFTVSSDENGYFVIDESFAEEWNGLVSCYTYAPDLRGFTEYDKLLPVQLGQMNHVDIVFSEDDESAPADEFEFYILCGCADYGIAKNADIYDFMTWKYNCGVKVAKYSYQNATDGVSGYLKLLYEDGTYFEWDDAMANIRFLCNVQNWE